MDTVFIISFCVLIIIFIMCIIFMRRLSFGKKQDLSELLLSQETGKETNADKKLEEAKERILHALVNERLYLNKELTLNMLAKSVQMNRHMVSQIINQEFKMNFYQLINKYRVKEFESLLIKTGNLEKTNIKELSKQAGFKTFSSFNSYFKQINGITPGEYKRSLRLPSLFQDEIS